MYSIYVICNRRNRKLYVGQSAEPTQRWKGHQSRARTRRPQQLVHHAIARHGVEAFTFDVIEQHETQADANDAEEFWIQYLGTMAPNGYNLARGCHSTRKTEATKEKLRQALLGVKHTEDRRRNISIAHLGQVPWSKGLPRHLNPLTGRKHSVETRRKMSEAAKAGNHVASMQGRSPTVKITRDDAEEIRRLHADGASTREIMSRYPLSKNSVRNIIRGITWT